ncbi:nuclear transport factor 2 family protein [Nocardia cerradoensis]|nr:nuclear transport factor 2 family protein [Nocardia cerradoensis]NKY43121.1 nuclear transport factor 2 family protein [Nocardia cerradoensis]
MSGEVPPTGKLWSRAGSSGEDGRVDSADRLAITALTAEYARAVDRRDSAALTALFAPDAVLVLPPVLNGTERAVELAGTQRVVSSVTDAVSRFVLTRHVVEQCVLEPVSRDRVRGEVYCTAHHVSRRPDGYRDRRVAIRYQDTFDRIGEHWLFSRRELVVDFIEDVAVRVPEAPGAEDAGRA